MRARREAAVDALAAGLLAGLVASAVADLVEMAREAAAFDRSPNGHFRNRMFEQLAKGCPDPEVWTDELVTRNADPGDVRPFLARVVAEGGPAAERVAWSLLVRPAYEQLVALQVLSRPTASADLLSRAVEVVRVPDRDWHYVLAGAGLPVASVARLLRHPDRAVRVAAAVGEWVREREVSVRPELEPAWRAAVAEMEGDDSYLDVILSARPELAMGWATATLAATADRNLWKHRRGFDRVAQIITRDQRRDLLAALVPPRVRRRRSRRPRRGARRPVRRVVR